MELQRELAELQTTEATRPAFATIRDATNILGLFDDNQLKFVSRNHDLCCRGGRGQDRQAAELKSLRTKSLEMEVHLLFGGSDWPPGRFGVNALAGAAQD